MPIELLPSIDHCLRHVPVQPNSREPERAIRFGKCLAETLPSLPIPKDMLKLFITQADQPPSWIEVRFDRVLLAILREKVGQRLFAETLEVLAHVGERPFFVGRQVQSTAGQRTNDLPAADVQVTEANGQDLLFVNDGSVGQ